MRNNNTGFSIIEIAIYVGILSIFVLGLASVTMYFKQIQKKQETLLDSDVEAVLGKKFLLKHIRYVSPSFNVLNNDPEFLDDLGRQFFDYNPNYLAKRYTPEERERIITLIGGTSKNKLSFLVEDLLKAYEKSSGVLVVDPVAAYDMTLGVNPSTIVADATKFRTYLNTMNPDLFQKAPAFLQLYVSTLIRTPGTGPEVIPKPVTIFQKDNGTSLENETFGGRINLTHVYEPTYAVNSLDRFFKSLPGFSGAIPVVLAKRVDLIRYEVAPSSTPGKYQLQYSKWNGTGFGTPYVVASGVTKVVFKRASITQSIINVEIFN